MAKSKSKKDLQGYKVYTEQINTLTQRCESNCNEIMFVNTNKTPGQVATISTFPLDAGEFVTYGGNQNEIDLTTYHVIQSNVGDVFVIKKIYV